MIGLTPTQSNAGDAESAGVAPEHRIGVGTTVRRFLVSASHRLRADVPEEARFVVCGRLQDGRAGDAGEYPGPWRLLPVSVVGSAGSRCCAGTAGGSGACERSVAHAGRANPG